MDCPLGKRYFADPLAHLFKKDFELMLKSIPKPKAKSAQDDVDDLLALIRMIEYPRGSIPADQKAEVDSHLQAAAKALRNSLH